MSASPERERMHSEASQRRSTLIAGIPHGRARSAGSQILFTGSGGGIATGSTGSGVGTVGIGIGSRPVSPSQSQSKLVVSTTTAESLDAISQRRSMQWDGKVSRSLGSILDAPGSGGSTAAAGASLSIGLSIGTSAAAGARENYQEQLRQVRGPKLLEADFGAIPSRSAGISDEDLMSAPADPLAQSFQSNGSVPASASVYSSSARPNYVVYSPSSNYTSPIMRSKSSFAINMSAIQSPLTAGAPPQTPSKRTSLSPSIPAAIAGSQHQQHQHQQYLTQPMTPLSAAGSGSVHTPNLSVTGSSASSAVSPAHQQPVSPAVAGLVSPSASTSGATVIGQGSIILQAGSFSAAAPAVNERLLSAIPPHVDTSTPSRSPAISARHSHIVSRSADSLNIPDEDGFLKDIELKGFGGIWSHAVARIYFLMYLLWKRQENFYFLRIDTTDFRNHWFHMTASQRVNNAKRIYSTYLSSSRATMPLRWPSGITDPTIDEVIQLLIGTLETPEPSMYDDISYITMQTLESIYAGTYVAHDGDPEPMQTQEGGEMKKFRRSSFYQAMRNDLRGTMHLTTVQHARVVERLADMSNVLHLDAALWDKVYVSLEGLCFDAESPVSKSIQLARKRTMQNVSQSSSFSRARSVSSLREDEPFSPTKTMRPAASNVARAFESSEANHTFLPYTVGDNSFCEFCFLRLGVDRSAEDPQAAYRCETVDLDIGPEFHSEKLRLVAEKLGALQKEVDIEMKIRDGLEKITKAKQAVSGKIKNKKGPEQDVHSQLERNTKKLEALKHEMQNTEDLQDGGLIRVLIEDPATKTESKKAIYIRENQSTIEVIERILEKANLPGIPTDFQLTYTNAKGDTINVKDEDRPLQIENIDFSHVFFKITFRGERIQRDVDNPLLKKQREILLEICDSEFNYLQDLKLIVQTFVRPFEACAMLDKDGLESVFSNIEEIVAVHESLSKLLKEATDEASRFHADLIIKCFAESAPSFKCYTIYCGNQHNARRLLSKLAQDQSFLKMLQKCESNPKLNKLSLADMLVKPMHRITRYPLLFKRLLPNLGTDSREQVALSALLIEIEGTISAVNETIKRREAAYRINQLDEILDFSVVSDRFRIAVDGRELVSEKSFMYYKKATNIPIDVTVILFTDMILIVRSKKTEQLQLLKQPIPLESVVLLDKPDDGSGYKNLFQVIHVELETHTLQALSSYDKNSWLQEAESVRARFNAMHYSIEQSYMRVQAQRYRHMGLARHTGDFDEQRQSQHDDGSMSPLPLASKIRRRISDASTRKLFPMNDAERLRTEEQQQQIKRQSSLMQLFRSRKQDEPTLSHSVVEDNRRPSHSGTQGGSHLRAFSFQSGDDSSALNSSMGGSAVTSSMSGIPTASMASAASVAAAAAAAAVAKAAQAAAASSASTSATSASTPSTASLMSATSAVSGRLDGRSGARGSLGEVLFERSEPVSASSSPKTPELIQPGSAKTRLGRKDTTTHSATRIITNIFRMSSPQEITSARAERASPVREFSSSVISVNQASATTTTETDVTQSSSFDIDSFLAEGQAPGNMSAVNAQSDKRRNLMGVVGKIRRSHRPSKTYDAPASE
nr:Rho guanine nucleotide exchange factor 3 [Polyrhizophydium stewartii]